MRSTIRLGIFVIASLVLIAAIVLSLQAPDIRNHLGVVPGLLANPLSIAIATGIVIFLVVERWRNIESEMNKLRDDQNQTLRDIKSDSEDLVKSKMDQVTNRAQAIEGKISDLVDKHPWVTDISEMEIIPDSPLCRVVLATAEELLVTKAPLLCYEYLSSVLRQDSHMSLEGVGSDFLDLAWFCGIGLQDDYLAYRAIAKGIDCSTSYSELVPHYLRLAIRYADYTTASRMARTIARQVNPRGVVRRYIIRQINSGSIMRHLPMFKVERSRRRDSEVAALASLAVFEAAYGRKDLVVRFFARARLYVPTPEESIVLKVAEIESMLFLGAQTEAYQKAKSLNVDPNFNSSTLMEVAFILQKTGPKDAATKANKILRARLKKRLSDKGQGSAEGQHTRESNGYVGNGGGRDVVGRSQSNGNGLAETQPDLGAQGNEQHPTNQPVAQGDQKTL